MRPFPAGSLALLACASGRLGSRSYLAKGLEPELQIARRVSVLASNHHILHNPRWGPL